MTTEINRDEIKQVVEEILIEEVAPLTRKISELEAQIRKLEAAEPKESFQEAIAYSSNPAPAVYVQGWMS